MVDDETLRALEAVLPPEGALVCDACIGKIAPDGVCEHWRLDTWEARGWNAGWGDGAIAAWPRFETLRRHDRPKPDIPVKRAGVVRYLVFCPWVFAAPVELTFDADASGMRVVHPRARVQPSALGANPLATSKDAVHRTLDAIERAFPDRAVEMRRRAGWILPVLGAQVCIDCEYHQSAPVPDPLPNDYVCPHFRPMWRTGETGLLGPDLWPWWGIAERPHHHYAIIAPWMLRRPLAFYGHGTHSY